MNWFAWVFTITLSAICVNYAHSRDPTVPDMELGTCYELIDVDEHRTPVGYNYERIGIEDGDVIHICHTQYSSEVFCLVVTKEINGEERSVGHEFEDDDFKFAFLKSITDRIEVFVFRADNTIRWNLSFTTQTYEILRDLYQSLIVDDNFTPLGQPRDLQKRNHPRSNYAPIATQPIVQVDHQFDNWIVIHITSPEGNQRRPLLVLMKKKLQVYTSEGNIVYMTVDDFPEEAYFFTCASPQEAEFFSDLLGKYSARGHAIFRINLNYLLPIV